MSNCTFAAFSGDLTGVSLTRLITAPVITTTSVILGGNKIQNGDIPVQAYRVFELLYCLTAISRTTRVSLYRNVSILDFIGAAAADGKAKAGTAHSACG